MGRRTPLAPSAALSDRLHGRSAAGIAALGQHPLRCVYALLLALSAAALALFLWWATAGLLDRQTEAAIRADAQGLSERLRRRPAGTGR